MTFIKSVATEKKVQSNLGLAKLKINESDLKSKSVKKTLTHITKHLSDADVTLDNLYNAIVNFLGIEINREDLHNVTEKLNLQVGKNVTYDNYAAVNIVDKNPTTLFFDMDGTLPATKNGNYYTWNKSYTGYYGERRFGVYNGKRLIAAYKLWSSIEPESDEQLWEEHETYDLDIQFENSLRGTEVPYVTVEDLKSYFKNYRFLASKYGRDSYDGLLLEMILDELQEELNIELMSKFVANQTSEVATALQTKKNITDKVQTAMDNSDFLNLGFTYVEFDNETDLAKIKTLENEWKEIKPQLSEMNVKPSLRFRKLGKHKATGLYSPSHNTLCVDIRNVQAMIHEVGHFIDFKLKGSNLSMQADFKPILNSYREQVNALPSDSYVVKKKNYYLTPTEVFARAYELYMSNKISTSFLKSEEDYQTLDAYTCFTDETKKLIKEFMDNNL